MTTRSTKRGKAAAVTTTTDDLELCSVDVTPGRAVYWDGEQREGLVENVPKHLAMEWHNLGYVAVVYEPS